MEPTDRDTPVARPVPRSWLAPHAVDSEQLDRMCADLELAQRMAAVDYTGQEWNYFATELIKYGLAVLTGWMRSGLIWARVADRTKIGGLPRPPEWLWRDDAWNEIAVSTLMVALPKFRDTVLLAGRWDPRGRASLKTFFIGQCLFRFPNAYRSWYTAAERRRDEAPDDLQDVETWRGGFATVSDPEQQTIARDELTRGLADLDERTRRVLQLRAQGYDQTEVGAHLGITRKTVEMIEARHRARRRRAGQPDDRRQYDDQHDRHQRSSRGRAS